MGTPVAPTFTRSALAPGLLGAMALLGGLALLDSPGYIVIRYAVSILAAEVELANELMPAAK